VKIHVIGSAPAVWGFALTGVGGVVVETSEALKQALDAALADSSIGIVLVTEDVARMARALVDDLMMQSELPLVVELPGPGDMSQSRPSIGETLHRMLGVEI
jgi:V/A-type H+/Na+-transporting ATPase subunit F